MLIPEDMLDYQWVWGDVCWYGVVVAYVVVMAVDFPMLFEPCQIKRANQIEWIS